MARARSSGASKRRRRTTTTSNEDVPGLTWENLVERVKQNAPPSSAVGTSTTAIDEDHFDLVTWGRDDGETVVGDVHLRAQPLNDAIKSRREGFDDLERFAEHQIDLRLLAREFNAVLNIQLYEPFIRQFNDDELLRQVSAVDGIGALALFSPAVRERVLQWIEKEEWDRLKKFGQSLARQAGLRPGRPPVPVPERQSRSELKPVVKKEVHEFCDRHKTKEQRQANLASALIEPLL